VDGVEEEEGVEESDLIRSRCFFVVISQSCLQFPCLIAASFLRSDRDQTRPPVPIDWTKVKNSTSPLHFRTANSNFT
jgi:hypothetical protein